MNRRRFLSTVSVTPLSFGILRTNPQTSSAGSQNDLISAPALLAILNEEREVIRIGHTYRKRNREEDDANLLQQRIRAALQPEFIDVRRSLKAVISADFEQGRTCQVNGWILSVTEARQCALYSILHA